MPKQRNAATADPKNSAAGVPLPDLTGVGLRNLRTMADPALTAAVESTLRHSAEFGEMWYSSGATVGKRTRPGGRTGR
ncbi:hypothetical protein [Streptomyces orinoci]|uniref:FXSXX-COOH protein n=1 Tax=Streptomyces orinoci TaxID=67339 RepID=A0ABV3JT37_STRON|nr:hypothetical protein [Streptomyces orinoci]